MGQFSRVNLNITGPLQTHNIMIGCGNYYHMHEVSLGGISRPLRPLNGPFTIKANPSRGGGAKAQVSSLQSGIDGWPTERKEEIILFCAAWNYLAQERF